MLTETEQEALFSLAVMEDINGHKKSSLNHLDQLIEQVPDNALFIQRRASVLSGMGRWDEAIDNYKNAIRLAPDHAEIYLSMGANLTWKLFESGDASILGNNPIFIKIIGYYQECIRRDPLTTGAWLNSIETNLFMFQWDDAISYYGMCKAYMSAIEDKLTLEWLGALATVLAGDALDEGEFSTLYNTGIKLEPGNYDIRQVNLVLKGLGLQKYYPQRLTYAKEIHQTYLDHFLDTTSKRSLYVSQ